MNNWSDIFTVIFLIGIIITLGLLFRKLKKKYEKIGIGFLILVILAFISYILFIPNTKHGDVFSVLIGMILIYGVYDRVKKGKAINK